jgi:hypothetical protein
MQSSTYSRGLFNASCGNWLRLNFDQEGLQPHPKPSLLGLDMCFEAASKVDGLTPINSHACHLVRDLGAPVVKRGALLALLRNN